MRLGHFSQISHGIKTQQSAPRFGLGGLLESPLQDFYENLFAQKALEEGQAQRAGDEQAALDKIRTVDAPTENDDTDKKDDSKEQK